MPTKTTPGPDWQRPEAAAVAPQLARLHDWHEGTDAVRANVSRYLPQLTKESPNNYALRSTGVPVPGHLTRTVEGSVGRLFAVAPTLDAGEQIQDDWHDLDGMGTHGDVWLANAAQWAILDGFALALVDAPPSGGGTVTLAQLPSFRPRWTMYRRAALVNWQVTVIGNRLRTTRLILRETHEQPNGEWASEAVPRVRVLRMTPVAGDGGRDQVTAEVWEEREEKNTRDKVWTLVEGPYTYAQQVDIPVAVLAAGVQTAPYCVRPPLLALCDKVVEFWQVQSDIRHYERMACFPQPVITGQLATGADGTPGQLVLGPTSAVQVDQGGSFAWAELSGSSLDALRAGQAERIREIGAMGLSFLVSETRSAETARAKALDAAAENASLARAARGIEDGANVALSFHARYYGTADTNAPTVSLNKNLSGETIDAALLRVLLDMRTAGELTRAEFREILARGRVLPAEMAVADAVAAAELEAALRGIVGGDGEGTTPPDTTPPAPAQPGAAP